MRGIKTVWPVLAVCAAVLVFLTWRPARDVSPQQIVPVPASGVAESVQNQAAPTPVSAPVVSYTSPAAPPVASVKKSLITGGAATDIPWTDRTPAALRVRRIFPDEKLMAPEPVLAKGDSIELALFDDAVLDAEISSVTRYVNGAVGLTAHLRNGREGTVFLSYCDGQMRASVQVMGGNDFYVKYNPKTRTHYAVEVDREKSIVLEGAEPLVPPVKDSAADAPAASVASASQVLADAPAGSTVVDVMIVYTPAALDYEGNVANMNANIAQAMQKANEAHTNSDTQIYLNLIHSAEVNYTETNAYTDLDRLTFTGGTNSAMDEVQTWRDQYGADFVCLFESTDDVGGLGWLLTSTGGNSSRAFCLARVQQSDWTYTVVHEWGHNMGCHHSKTQTAESGASGGVYTFSAGWQWDDTAAGSPKRGYCTIMTYEDFNNDGTKEYVKVAYFSNPTNYYIGNRTNAMGHATNGDNARTIRQMKTVLAGYRVSAPDVTLSLSGSPMAEAGGAATVTATLSKTYTLPVTVNLVFSGAAAWPNDYMRSATNIVIAAGGLTGLINLTAVHDAVYEGNETIVVDIDSVVNGTEPGAQQVTATIVDDDPKPDDLRVTPLTRVMFVGPVGGGSVSPSSHVYTLLNAGTNALNWSAAETSSWLNLSATGGALAAGAATNVTVSVNSGALAEGVYYDTILFTNLTRGISNITRQAGMTVTPPYIYFFPLETDPGWERSGEWAFGQPAGQGGAAHGNPDPANGATGTNVFGVNLSGDYATASAGGPYYLKAGPFNFSGHTNVTLHFQRWLNTDAQDYVLSMVDVSFNGTTWVQIYANVGEVADADWTRCEYNISSVADRQSFVYVRWSYQMLLGNNSAYAFSGWNVDDIGFLGTSVPVTPYTVTFDAQNGTAPDPASKIVTNGATYGALPGTTRAGYTFGGWWTGEEGSGEQITSTTTVTIISAQVLYAKWIPPPSTLTVNNGSGSGSYVSPQQVVITANPPAIGKTFDRWTGDTQRVASVTSSPTTVRMPVSNITITATYRNIEYPLTVNGGAGGGAYIYGTNVTITATPVAGKAFFKWLGATQYVAGITSSTAVVTMPASAITLTASNVVDTTKPTVAITSPKAAQRILSNATYTVTGTAADNKVVTNVMVKLNDGAYAPAVTTNKWKTWSVQVHLADGSNTVRAYSTDSAFNNSATAAVSCTYVVVGNLTIQTNGSGKVTIAPAGAAEVGKTYTLTAAANTGSAFANWTGDNTTTNKVIKFTMTSNMTFTANFTDNEKPKVAITVPAALQKVYGTNGDFTVRGTASDNLALSNIMVKVNSGSFAPAGATTNVWKNWSQAVTLISGTNTIAAYSVDTTGNNSATVTVKCVYTETGALNITTNGPGKVTVAPTGPLLLGKTYTLTAAANVGAVFSNWTGYVTSTGKVVTVTLNATNKIVAVTANFVDTAKPTVVITYPANNAKVLTNGLVVIRGTAADNGALSEVKYQLRTGDWTNAVSTNVFKAWTADYVPVAGLNTSKVYSVDAQGNVSATSTVVFTYIPGAVLTVQTNGRGTITPAYNGKVLQIGSTNTMTAAPKAGSTSTFVNWTYGIRGSVATNTKAIKFVMQSNLVLTANFFQPIFIDPVADAVADVLSSPQAIVVDGATADWANVPSSPVTVYYPDSANPVVAVTQDVSAVLSGNNIALLLTGCPFGTSDTVLVYFKLRLTYGSGDNPHTLDLWTSGSVLYGMVDGRVVTGLEAILLDGVLEVKFPVSDNRLPSNVVIETVGVMLR